MSSRLDDYSVVLASAGTGKTFQLSNRFLYVIAREPTLDPAKVLATTFTRKAAGEILDRVLQRLSEAALSEKKAAELDGFIGLKLGREGYVALCVRVAGAMHRLAIQTIDAFTARVVGALGLDLGLPPGWRIAEEDEDARLRVEAVDAALRDADRDEIFALISLWHAGGFGRSAHKTLLKIIAVLYDAYLLARAKPEPWHSIRPEHETLDGEAVAQAIRAVREGDFASATSGKPSSAIEKACGVLAECADGHDWECLLGSTIARNVQSGLNSYSRAKLQESLVGAIRDLAEHAAGMSVENLAARNSAAFNLITRFDAAYQKLKARRGLYRFDDLPRHVLARPFEDLLTRLYFRLDAQVQHLLFDEFQDTSTLQFNLLYPMCDELLSQQDGSRTFLCVGDTKQSLYGWRGAQSRLLGSIPALWSTVHTHELAVSFRSSQTVLDSVNQVFGGLATNENLLLTPPGADAAAAWTASYQTHRAHQQHLTGRVRLWSVAEDEEKEGDPCVLAAVDRVAEIRAFAPNATIGILVRANRMIPVMIHELALRGIPASEEGASLLTDAAAVAAAASLFHLADHPDDSASLFHLASSPFGPLLGIAADDVIPRGSRADHGARLSREVRAELARVGYQRFCERLVTRLAPFVDERGLRRLEQMAELAVAFDRRRAPRPSELAKLLRTKRVADPLAMNVRVMTIHQSKGLEFDAVILPQLEKSRHDSPAVLVDHLDEHGNRSPFNPVSDVSIAPPEAVGEWHSRLRDMRRNTLAGKVSEELCVLYVAMTRAIHSLEMIIPERGSDPKSVATPDLLCAAFRTSRVKSGDALLFDSGEAQWTPAAAKHKPARESIERPIVLKKTTRPPTSRWLRRSPSSLEGGTTRTLDSVLCIEPTHGLERGTLIHAFCEQVAWLEDGPLPTRSRLLHLAGTLGWSVDDAGPEVDRFLARLGGPLASVFGRGRYPAGSTLRVRREWAFVAPATVGDQHIVLNGQIDRLVTFEENGRVVGAEVLDFKTDGVTPGEQSFTDRVEHYRPQLNAYRAAVAKVFGLSASAVRATLVFLEPGVEVVVEP